MSEIRQGRFVRAESKGGKITLTLVGPTKKGDKSQSFQVRHGVLSQELTSSKESEVEVDYEFDDKGLPYRIRPRGQPWQTAPEPASERRPSAGPRHAPGGGGRQGPGSGREARHERVPGNTPVSRDFHNPYNFVPALDPKDGKWAEGLLGHGSPCGHDRYQPERYSGSIEISIIAKTPLIIPDTSRVEIADNGHHTLPLLTGPDGKPLLRPTSLKGCLRAAYEAITNSRLGVFQGHDERLARRMDAGEGLAMVPARVSDDGKSLELWLGPHATVGTPPFPAFDGARGRYIVPAQTMYAAWFRGYDRRGRNTRGPHYDNDVGLKLKNSGKPAVHGEPIVCLLEEVMKVGQSGNPIFHYWSVVEAVAGSDFSALTPPARATSLSRPPLGDAHRRTGEFVFGKGYVCVTGQNIGNKHDERVFFVPQGRSLTPWRLDPTWKEEWNRLVRDYREKAKPVRELRKAKGARTDWAYLGRRDPGDAAFSRHIYTDGADELKPGDLCYARVDKAGKTIIGLYPVMIARELAEVEPEEFLPGQLRPATTLAELSPADRVFGWVHQRKERGTDGKRDAPRGREAWRGQLRIADVQCMSSVEDSVQTFERPGLPLAILSTPKPEQARFYLARDREGTPQDNMDRDAASYRDPDSKRLRGRKVYPHHAKLPAGYWDDPRIAFNAQQEPSKPQQVSDGMVGRYREFVRVAENADKLRNDQNRSILGWVKPGAQFTARIDVTNLNAAELGALLYLLRLPSDHFHRLGGGKPLGFGSVRVDIVALDLQDGAARKAEYATLLPMGRDAKAGKRHLVPTRAGAEPDTAAIASEIDEAVKEFKKAIAAAYGAPFEDVRFIKAFHNAARGFADKPVHYPRPGLASENRPRVPPHHEGKNFEWFVENNRRGIHSVALDALWDPTGLPYLEQERRR